MLRGLSKLADYFVMDAFGTAIMRTLVPRVCGHMKLNAAGFLMEKELIGCRQAPKRPMMAIVGGIRSRPDSHH
jgi:3-phosphoglycerate kinase